MTDTAATVITKAFRLFGIIDSAEQPTTADLAAVVPILNDLLRQEQADGACQYLIGRVTVQLPPGTPGLVYSFSVGTGSNTYLVQKDAVAVRAIWMNDISATVNRETRTAPIADVVRTTQLGIITKWHQERQADGSVLVTAWQPPRASTQALIEFGSRLAPITNLAGTDAVALPPEGIHDASLLLGRRIMGSYGRVLSQTDPIVIDAERVNTRWREWSRGQMWLRFVRS
jgi:hypothetical protein